MAGDWIKLRIDIDRDPAVFRLAAILGVERFAVVGRLSAFWGWVNRHSTDGRVDAPTASTVIDAVVECPGFAAAMVSVGWLQTDATGFTVPKFERFNDASAKLRTAKTARQARWRAAKASTVDAAVGARVDAYRDAEKTAVDAPREEKRREEKKKDPPTPAGGDGATEAAAEKARLKAAADAARAELADGFAAFWQAYPKKQSKPDAERAYLKLAPPPDLLRAILDAVARQKTWHGWLKDGGQFIPNPATWLNGKRWGDEPPAVPAGGPADRPRTARAAEDEFAAQMFADALAPGGSP